MITPDYEQFVLEYKAIKLPHVLKVGNEIKAERDYTKEQANIANWGLNNSGADAMWILKIETLNETE